MDCQGFRSAVRCGDKILRAGGSSSRRTFSSSTICQKHGPVPKFTQTSSYELDGILTSFRNKVVMPAHLSEAQKNLIYKRKYSRMLEVEPIMANLRGEEFRLESIDLLKDVPSRKSVISAVMKMGAKSDWDNLPAILIGLKNSGRAFKPNEHYWEQVIRKATNAGRVDVIFECARRVDETGLRFDDVSKVLPIMLRLQEEAAESNWNPKTTAKALLWAERIVEMLEEEKHLGGSGIRSNDPRYSSGVIGVLLQLTAVQFDRNLNVDGVVPKIRAYAMRLLSNKLTTPPPNDAEPYTINMWLYNAMPCLHGMILAHKTLTSLVAKVEPGSDWDGGQNARIASELKATVDVLQEVVDSRRQTLLEHPNLSAEKREKLSGLRVYNRLLVEYPGEAPQQKTEQSSE